MYTNNHAYTCIYMICTHIQAYTYTCICTAMDIYLYIHAHPPQMCMSMSAYVYSSTNDTLKNKCPNEYRWLSTYMDKLKQFCEGSTSKCLWNLCGYITDISAGSCSCAPVLLLEYNQEGRDKNLVLVLTDIKCNWSKIITYRGAFYWHWLILMEK